MTKREQIKHITPFTEVHLGSEAYLNRRFDKFITALKTKPAMPFNALIRLSESLFRHHLILSRSEELIHTSAKVMYTLKEAELRRSVQADSFFIEILGEQIEISGNLKPDGQLPSKLCDLLHIAYLFDLNHEVLFDKLLPSKPAIRNNPFHVKRQTFFQNVYQGASISTLKTSHAELTRSAIRGETLYHGLDVEKYIVSKEAAGVYQAKYLPVTELYLKLFTDDSKKLTDRIINYSRSRIAYLHHADLISSLTDAIDYDLLALLKLADKNNVDVRVTSDYAPYHLI